MKYDLELIKSKLPEYLERIGVSIKRRSETHISAPCPIHNGHDANFHADLKAGGVWTWTCRSQCGGIGGTVLDLHAALHGLIATSKDAIAGTAAVLDIQPDNEPTRPLSPQERAERTARTARHRDEQNRQQEQERITAAIAAQRKEILLPYFSESWRADFYYESPITPQPDIDDQARQLLEFLFQAQDLLWMGEERDSGQPQHAANFRTRDEWLKADCLPPRIASGIFQPGSISRSSKNIARSPFILIEADELIGHKPSTDEERRQNRALCAALIILCRDKLRLNLRAVISTGSKSLHGWFDRPPDNDLAALQTIAEAIGIDAPVLTRAHGPLRRPGCVHQTSGYPATLCYLNHLSI